MKNILKITFAVCFLAVISSCVKEDTFIGPDSPGAVKAVVEFKNPGPINSSTQSSIPVYKFNSDRVASKEVTVEVNYTGVGGAPNDIRVKIKVDNDVAQLSRTEQQVNYDIADDDKYDISATELVIPKGKKSASFTVTYYPEHFSRVFYILGLSITEVSGTNAPISGNFGKISLFMGTKNQWDGDYTYTATTSLGDASGEDAHMTTAGDYSVTMDLVNYYSNQVVFTVDPNTNKVTVSMTTLLPIATDTDNSYWDPDTKTFHVKWTSNAGARTYTETYVKQ